MKRIRKIISLVLSAAMLGSGFAGITASAEQSAESAAFKGTSPDNGDGTFRNPMLLTDVADPDCVAGYDPSGKKAYYMVSTAMSYSPGAPIMRSYDLVNWENVSYVYDSLDYASDALSLRNNSHAYGKGQWAASMRYHAGTNRYYVLFSSYTTGKTYVYSAENPEDKQWHKTVIDGAYHDPSLYIDTDGQMYALFGTGQLECVRLLPDEDGFVTVDESFEQKTVIPDMGAYIKEYNPNYDPVNGDHFIIEGEGSHAYCIDGKMYIIFISWPKENIYRRIMVCYQADSFADGIENGFKSKVIFNDTVGYAGGEGVAQGGIMNTTGAADSSDGDWKGIIYQDRGPVGRCPFLLDVNWETDGDGLKWPMLSTAQTMTKPITGFPSTSVVVSDDFTNGDEPNVLPALTKGEVGLSYASLPDIETAAEASIADSIVFNPSCDGNAGQGPWYWGAEDGKSGAVITVEDENDTYNKYMRITGRQTSDAGIFQWCNKPDAGSDDKRPQNGKTYDISFRARFSSASDGAPDKETFVLKLDDSVLASGTVQPDTWTTVTGKYTFGDNEVDDWNAYRIMTENSTVDFDIDDVFISEAKEEEAEGTEKVSNGDMESVDPSSNLPYYWGINDEAASAGAAVGASADAHGGSSSLAVSGRSAARHAARQYIELTPGFEYAFSAWIKCNTADTFKAVLLTNYWIESDMASGAVKAGEWTRISGKFTVPTDWNNGMFYILSENTADDFLVDDVSIKELPGQIHETPKEGENDYNGSNLNLAWQWTHVPDNTCWSLTDRDGWLRITTNKPTKNIQLARNVLTQRSYGPQSAGTIKMDVSHMKNGDYAGLTTMQTRYGNIGVKMTNGKKYFVYQYIKEDAYNGEITDANWLKLEPQEVVLGELNGNEAYVRLEYFFGNFDNKKEDGTAYFHYSTDGKNWKYAGMLTRLNYDLKQFTGYRFGIFNYASEEAGGYVDYDYFKAEDEIIGEGKTETPSPAPTQEVSYDELIKNGDFETGNTAEWGPFGNSSLEAVPDMAHSGRYGLKVSGRSQNWEGACQTVSGIVSEQMYRVYADVAAETDAASTEINITITYADKDGNPQYIGIGSVSSENGKWSVIDKTFMLHGELPETVTVYISSSNSGEVLYADNVSIKAVRDPGTRGRDIGMHNALITQRFGADPFAMEYDGRLYVYMTGDKYRYVNGELQGNDYTNVNSIAVISTDDMVNWTDHGAIPVGAKNTAASAEPGGAVSWASNSWAPTAVHKTINGKEKFFLYFADNGSGIGVLEADSPTGPFHDPLGESLVARGKTPGTEGVAWCFDPAVLIDDDGQAYMYFGGGIPTDENGNEISDNPKTARVIKLGDDMISTVGEAVEIDAPGILEDSGIHKYGDTYYYSYCTNFNCTNVPTGAIAYMTSKDPMGPFEYKGVVLENMWVYFGIGGNNHHAMFEYKGKWYITYHSQIVDAARLGSPMGYRSSHINELEYNEDGTLKRVEADYEGVPQIKNLDPYAKVEAETIAWNKGIETENYSSKYTGNMKVTSIDNGDWISVSQADFGDSGAERFTVKAASNKGGTLEIRLDAYDGAVADEIEIPNTGGSFKTISADIKKITGVHDLFFTFKGDGNDLFELDSWSFGEMAGWDLTASVSSGKVNINASNNTAAEDTAVIYTAAYDADGKLVKVAVSEKRVPANETVSLSEDMSGVDYDKISVFAWQVNTLKPLAYKTEAEEDNEQEPNLTEYKITSEKGVDIQDGMIGLFFEDINYAADGGLYAEMIENRSFEALKNIGYGNTAYDGTYSWSAYPASGSGAALATAAEGGLNANNTHYAVFTASDTQKGLKNSAYDGVLIEEGKKYNVSLYARSDSYNGGISVSVYKDGEKAAAARVTDSVTGEWQKYTVEMTADKTARRADFVVELDGAGEVMLDMISCIPQDSVDGIFRRDLAEKLKAINPGFLRFPGGCVIEGYNLDNRYNWKNTLGDVSERKQNLNRWADHIWEGIDGGYKHYNQTLGLGFYEYFLLCEYLECKAVPVVNAGMACQYQSNELVGIDTEEFKQYIQDALDLIEFANGGTDTKYGKIRAEMGHPEPFNLEIIGIGNEQWQTDWNQWFTRYERFEAAIHEKYPDMKLVATSGPGVQDNSYNQAWSWIREKSAANDKFAYVVDEHYYREPDWFYGNMNFYDSYPRDVKVFAGEYASRRRNWANDPAANTWEAALSEAAYLTMIERNADVVYMASYAPLFARINYTQWSPDMIWFDDASSYGSPTYYVQKLYSNNMGDYTLRSTLSEYGSETGVYSNASYDTETGDIIIKIANSNDTEKKLPIKLEGFNVNGKAKVLYIAADPEAWNSIDDPEKVSYKESAITDFNSNYEYTVPASSFTVLRIGTK